MGRILTWSVLAAVTLAIVYGLVLDGFGLVGGSRPESIASRATPAPETAATDHAAPGQVPSSPAAPSSATAVERSATSGEGMPASPGRSAGAAQETGPARPLRDVTPPNVLALPTRPFVDPVRDEEPVPEERSPLRRYHRVVVRDAGTLQANGVTIHFAGVSAVPGDRSCTDGGGRSWPCGRIAAAELRLLIRNKAVDCTVVSESADEVVGTCSAGLRDINGWLVEHGWAQAEGEAYSSEADTARRESRGIYLAEWRERGEGGSGTVPLEHFSAPEIIPGAIVEDSPDGPSNVLPELAPQAPVDQ